MDGDGYGYPFNVVYAPDPPEFYVGNNEDCDDNNPLYHPGVAEICDGLDNECDGAIDEGITPPECHICIGAKGFVIDNNYCIIEDICYSSRTISSLSPCLICDPLQSQTSWSLICNPTEACCDDICIDISEDINNCGGCGIVCDDENPCTTDICVQGVCEYINVPNGTPCSNGLCD